MKQDLQTCVTAIQEIEEDVVRGFGGLTDEFRFETLLNIYACLAGQPYKYQDVVGSIAKKLAVVDHPVEGGSFLMVRKGSCPTKSVTCCNV